MNAPSNKWIKEQLVEKFGEPPWKLNLGCGMDRIEDHISIDCEAKAEPDLIMDIERPWQMPKNCVVEIIAKHVVEHLHNVKMFFQECYRVMLPGSELLIIVPHHTSDFFWGDPTHVRPITRMTLELLSQKACAEIKEKKLSNTPLAVYWDVDFELVECTYALHDEWKDKFDGMDDAIKAISTYNNIAAEVHFIMRCVKEGNIKWPSA
jgi:SAM-dependent methyltransferase